MLKTINGGKAPTKGSKYSACIDLYAREDVVIGAGDTAIVPLGVCIDSDFFAYEIGDINVLPNGEVISGEYSNEKITAFLKSHYLKLEPRSSLRAKGIQAGTGIIDLDYKDEICIILHNQIREIHIDEIEDMEQINYFENNYKFNVSTFSVKKISKGDKIAQIMLCPHKTFLMGIETDEERVGGFGSTGEK